MLLMCFFRGDIAKKYFSTKIIHKSVLRAPQELQKPVQTVSEGHRDTRNRPGAFPKPYLLLFSTL